MNSLMQSTESSCIELAAALVPDAEKELAAYARAVYESYGAEQVGQSVEDWMAELDSVEWPLDGKMADWRRVTIAAAHRLAIRTQHPTFRNAAEFATFLCQAS